MLVLVSPYSGNGKTEKTGKDEVQEHIPKRPERVLGGGRATTALEVIRQVYRHGGKLTLDGSTLKVSAPAPLPDDLRQALWEHKPVIMAALDTVIHNILSDIRPHLPGPIRQLPDDKLLTMVNWPIMAAWNRAIQALDQEMGTYPKRGKANA